MWNVRYPTYARIVVSIGIVQRLLPHHNWLILSVRCSLRILSPTDYTTSCQNYRHVCFQEHHITSTKSGFKTAFHLLIDVRPRSNTHRTGVTNMSNSISTRCLYVLSFLLARVPQIPLEHRRRTFSSPKPVVLTLPLLWASPKTHRTCVPPSLQLRGPFHSLSWPFYSASLLSTRQACRRSVLRNDHSLHLQIVDKLRKTYQDPPYRGFKSAYTTVSFLALWVDVLSYFPLLCFHKQLLSLQQEYPPTHHILLPTVSFTRRFPAS